MNELQTEWIRSAYEMLDWLSEHPDYIPRSPIYTYRWYWEHEYRDLDAVATDTTTDRVKRMLDSMREAAAVLRDGAAIGTIEKIDSDSTYGLTRKFGEHRFSLCTASSATCSLVPTDDVKEVVSYEIPDDVRERYKVVKTETVMKKVCPPITKREL